MQKRKLGNSGLEVSAIHIGFHRLLAETGERGPKIGRGLWLKC